MKTRNKETSHHNIPLSILGGALIWGGWYSFNGGSASLLLNNLTSGYYYIKLSASPYNYPNCGVPAPWDNPYSFNISYSTTSTDNISISKDLIKITDVLGREVNEKRNTPLFYIYNDGTVEKKIIIE